MTGHHKLAKLTHIFYHYSCRHFCNNQGNTYLKENHTHHSAFHNMWHFKNVALEFFDIPPHWEVAGKPLSLCVPWASHSMMASFKEVMSQEGASKKHFKLHPRRNLCDILWPMFRGCMLALLHILLVTNSQSQTVKQSQTFPNPGEEDINPIPLWEDCQRIQTPV